MLMSPDILWELLDCAEAPQGCLHRWFLFSRVPKASCWSCFTQEEASNELSAAHTQSYPAHLTQLVVAKLTVVNLDLFLHMAEGWDT